METLPIAMLALLEAELFKGRWMSMDDKPQTQVQNGGMNPAHSPMLAPPTPPSSQTLKKVVTLLLLLLIQKHQYGGITPINILTAISR